MLCMLSCLFSLAVAINGEWWIKPLVQPYDKIFTGEKFVLSYSNMDHWMNNASFFWNTDERKCSLSNQRLPEIEVICYHSGQTYFGISTDQNPNLIMEFKQQLIYKSTYEYTWQVNKRRLSNTQYLVSVRGSRLADIQNETVDKVITKMFYGINFMPKVLMQTNSEEFTNVTANYNHNASAWEFLISLLNLDDTILIEVDSLNSSALFSTKVRPTVQIIQREKYNLSLLTAAKLKATSTLIESKLIEDTFSQNVAVLVMNETLHFLEGFTQMNDSSRKDGFEPLTELLLSENRIAIISNGDIVLVDSNGSETVILKEGNMNWTKLVSCENYPKFFERRCDILVALNQLKERGVFYTYNITKDLLVVHQVPFCSDQMSCEIKDIQISLTLDLVRVLADDCQNLKCEQIFVDYYLSSDTWKLLTRLNKSVFSFRFFPQYSTDMLLFTSNGIYQLGEDLTLKDEYEDEDEVQSKDVKLWHENALILFQTGFAVHFQYGGKKWRKIFVGRNTFLQRSNEMFFMYEINNKQPSEKQIYPLQLELDAASHIAQCSVLRYSSSIEPTKIYSIDKLDILKFEFVVVATLQHDHKIKVSIDQSLGLLVKLEHTKLLSDYLMKIVTNVTVQLNEELHVSLYSYPRVTSVTFNVVNYEGHVTYERFSQSLFLSIGCPAHQYLHINVKQGSIFDCHLTDFGLEASESSSMTIRCVEGLIDEEIVLQTELFQGDYFKRSINGRLMLESISIDQDKITIVSQTDVETTISGKEVGTYVIRMKLHTNSSLCDNLMSIFVLRVKDHYTNKRTLIIVIVICICLVICTISLAISFIAFKKQTEKEHAAEAEVQKRQQQLRFLATLQHYQDQMDVNSNTAVVGVARRRSSGYRRSSSIIPEDVFAQARANILTPVMEE